MPADMAGKAAFLGGLTGLLLIGWIVLNIIFLHQLTEQNGSFKMLQDSIAGITEDRRLQLLLIAFAFGAFLADLGLCRFPWHEANLAGHFGHGGELCYSAVPGVQLHGP